MRSCIIVIAVCLLALTGCRREARRGAEEAARSATARPAAAPPAGAKQTSGAPAAAPASRVARIVFLDKHKACECDRDRIEASWKALSTVVSKTPGLVVERVHFDTQPLLAAPLKAMRAVMVPPGLYFLGKDGKLVTMLQGEVKEAQIHKALKR